MDSERLKLWRGRAVRCAPAGRMRDGGALQRDIAREVVSFMEKTDREPNCLLIGHATLARIREDLEETGNEADLADGPGAWGPPVYLGLQIRVSADHPFSYDPILQIRRTREDRQIKA